MECLGGNGLKMKRETDIKFEKPNMDSWIKDFNTLLKINNYKFFEDMANHHSQANPKYIQRIGEPTDNFIERLLSTFYEAKVFEINKDINELLLMTDGTKSVEHLPFDKIFLDTDFDVSHLHDNQFNAEITHIKGLLIAKVDEVVIMNSKNKNEGKAFRLLDLKRFKTFGKSNGFKIWALCLDVEGGYSFNTINILNKLDIKYNFEISSHNPKVRKFVLEYVSNFLNLLNNPRDIEIVVRKYSEAKNRKRVRQGLNPIPSKKVIVPVGTLKQYIQQYKQSNDDFKYSHKFWVRGHWREFKSDKYIQVKGKRKWIYPYIKGKGILIDKKYQMKDKEVVDVNEKTKKKINTL